MKLFQISNLQDVDDLLNNRIVFKDQNLQGSFDSADQFLCRTKEGRYFVSTIRIVDNWPHVDYSAGRICLDLTEVKAIYLIKEESDKWPEGVSVVNAISSH